MKHRWHYLHLPPLPIILRFPAHPLLLFLQTAHCLRQTNTAGHAKAPALKHTTPPLGSITPVGGNSQVSHGSLHFLQPPLHAKARVKALLIDSLLISYSD